jgi:hypothetical protein
MNSMMNTSQIRPAQRQSSGLSSPKLEGYHTGVMENFTPEQMQLFQRMFGQAGPDSFLGKLAGGDSQTFEEMEAPAMKQFSQLLGGLSSRAGGLGGGVGSGGGWSSAAQNKGTSAAADFAQQLQANRLNLQNQATQQLFNMGQTLLGQKPFERYMQEERMPFWQQMLLGLAGGTGDIIKGIGSFF